MKYRKISLVLAMMLAASLTSCGSKDKKAEDTSAAEENTVEKISPNSIVFDWQESYGSILSEFASSADHTDDSRFDLVDLNSDGTPELVISPGTDPSSACSIYTFSDGTAVKAGEEGSKGEFSYIPEKEVCHSLYAGDTFDIGEYFQLTDSELVPVMKYYSSYAINDGESTTFEIDDESVTRKEFEEARAEYTSVTDISVGRRYTFAATAVDYALHYSESWQAVMTKEQKQLYADKLGEYIEIEYPNGAFELCDINGDDLPELIFSTGTYEADVCRIFTIDDSSGHAALSEVSGDYGGFGTIGFDIDGKVIFAETAEGQKCWDITGTDLGAYTSSGSTMVCGRKYFLSSTNITAVLN